MTLLPMGFKASSDLHLFVASAQQSLSHLWLPGLGAGTQLIPQLFCKLQTGNPIADGEMNNVIDGDVLKIVLLETNYSQ